MLRVGDLNLKKLKKKELIVLFKFNSLTEHHHLTNNSLVAGGAGAN
jgi:hypothetical protein